MSSYAIRYRNIFFGFFSSKQRQPKGLKQGKWKEFNKHAILIAEGNYCNGMKQGRWKEYFDSGELLLEEDFDNGISNGRFASYHKNGMVLCEGHFNYGIRDGEFKVYDENGAHIRSLLFENDCLIEEVDYRLNEKPACKY